MIFVTVGTHEQQFNRLIEYIDKLVADGKISEQIIMQIGYCTYEPKHCCWKRLYSYKKMNELVNKARIVITHGGPSSFIMPLQDGKIPIVVPRKFDFDEHVNNHQVAFTRAVADRMKTVILVEEVENLLDTILCYDEICAGMTHELRSNNKRFNEHLRRIVDEMFVK